VWFEVHVSLGWVRLWRVALFRSYIVSDAMLLPSYSSPRSALLGDDALSDIAAKGCFGCSADNPRGVLGILLLFGISPSTL
jgi:hypothetical protein